MVHAFLSYVREDYVWVEELASALRAHEVSVWLDRKSLRAGQRWQDAIRLAITSGNCFIACFSASYSARRRTYMNTEISLAIEILSRHVGPQQWFVPVLLPGGKVPRRVIPGQGTLCDIHAADFRDNWEGGLHQLLDAILPLKLRAEERARHLIAALARLDDHAQMQDLANSSQDADTALEMVDREIIERQVSMDRLARVRMGGAWQDAHYRLESINKDSHRLDQLRAIRAVLSKQMSPKRSKAPQD